MRGWERELDIGQGGRERKLNLGKGGRKRKLNPRQANRREGSILVEQSGEKTRSLPRG